MSEAWPQFPLDEAVWISHAGDLIPFEFFLKSSKRLAPVLLLPTGSGLSPKQTDIVQITRGMIHLVLLDTTLAPRLSNRLQTGVDKRTAFVFWPVTHEGDPVRKTSVSYLPRANFMARLIREMNQYEPAPSAPRQVHSRPSPVALPPRRIPRSEPAGRALRPVAHRVHSDAQSARSSYRAFFDVEGHLIQPALKELGSWLAEKQLDADLSTNSTGSTDVDGTRYEWTFTRGTSAKSEAFHFVMNQASEDNPVTFTTVMTADEKADGRGSWLFLHVYNDGDQPCGTPRIAKALLKSLTVEDGDRPLRSGPLRINEAGVDELLQSLRSRVRRLPIQIIATDETLGSKALAELPRLAAKWTKSLAGQSHVVILDPPATTRFNSLVPDEFCVRPWTLRTYRPGIALIGLMEARQQREISTTRLAESPDWKIDRLLVGATRAITQQHPAPREVREVQALLARLERAERVEQAHPVLTPEPPADQPTLPLGDPQPADTASPKVDQPSEPQPRVPQFDDDLVEAEATVSRTDIDHRLAQLHDAILQTLGVAELTDEVVDDVLALLTEPDQQSSTTQELEQQLLEVQNERNALLETASELRDEGELTEAELLNAQQEIHKRERELRFLRQELIDAGAAEAAYSYVDEDPLTGIADIFDVLERVPRFEYVVPTWNDDEVMDLDEIDNFGNVPKIAWSALTVMERYCRAKKDDGYAKGFQHFVEEHGELLTPKRVAMGETAQTMARWGDERRFPVPTEVDPSGYVHMEAHIKLTRDGINSPRMHFYDDTNRTGKIYVGYLGRHLTNTKTANM